MALQFSRESYIELPPSTIMDVNPEHPLKASLPMLVSLFGMVTDVNPEHPSKAEPPMLVTPLPMVSDVNPEQPLKA